MSNHQPMQRAINQLYASVLTRLPLLAWVWSKTFKAVKPNQRALVAFKKPLDQARFALVTTGGVHLTDQQPYIMSDSRGDPSYRVIPANTPRERLMITHDYYNHQDAERDLNILFPLALFRDLVHQGIIGSLATSYSFMGHIEPPHVETLQKRTAPEVAGKLKQEQVDAVLLTPAWGICNQSVGLIAHVLEASGIATVCIIGLKTVAEQVRPPRTVFLQWPFGHPLGEPSNRAQHLSVVAYALKSLDTITTPGTILEPGWRWRREQYTEPEW